MADWKSVYQFPQGEKMLMEIHQSNLYYRNKGSAGRISYQQIKKGLKLKLIRLPEPPLPF